MSYILEALKKAEQQRDLGRVPGIDSVHEQASGAVRGRWLWVVAAVLVLNATVLLVLFWPEQRREPEAMQSVPTRQPADYPAPMSERPGSLAASQVEPQEPADAVAELPQLAVRSPDAPRQHRELANPVTVDNAEIPARPPAPVARPATAAQLPVWPRIPAYLFEQLGGGLRLDVHVFAPQPAERFVLINLKKYRQGEELQEGPRLDEITAEGAILSFRGERFRLQAQ
jgi:general secretion pathway protein B